MRSKRVSEKVVRLGMLGLASLVWPEPRQAHACSGPQCSVDQFLPRSGTLPANAPAIAWYPGFNWTEDEGQHTTQLEELSLRCALDGIDQDVELAGDPQADRSVWLTPEGGLPEGATCTLRPATLCETFAGYDPIEDDVDVSYLEGIARFEVTPPAELPDTLGALRAEDAALEVRELAAGASCSLLVDVCSVRVTLELSAAAEPWRDAFVYTTWVDAERWWTDRYLPLPNEYGGSYLGRGRDLLVALEEEDPNDLFDLNAPTLEHGTHRVKMRAELAGTDIVLETEEIEVDLDCGTGSMENIDPDDPEPDEPDMSTRDAGADTSDAGDREEPHDRSDGGTRSDEADDRGQVVPRVDGGDDSSSSCAASPPQRGAGAGAFLALGLLCAALLGSRLRLSVRRRGSSPKVT